MAGSEGVPVFEENPAELAKRFVELLYRHSGLTGHAAHNKVVKRFIVSTECDFAERVSIYPMLMPSSLDRPCGKS